MDIISKIPLPPTDAAELKGWLKDVAVESGFTNWAGNQIMSNVLGLSVDNPELSEQTTLLREIKEISLQILGLLQNLPSVIQWEASVSRAFPSEASIITKFDNFITYASLPAGERESSMRTLSTAILSDTSDGISAALLMIHNVIIGNTILDPAQKGLIELWNNKHYQKVLTDNEYSHIQFAADVQNYVNGLAHLQMQGLTLYCNAAIGAGKPNLAAAQAQKLVDNLALQLAKRDSTVPLSTFRFLDEYELYEMWAVWMLDGQYNTKALYGSPASGNYLDYSVSNREYIKHNGDMEWVLEQDAKGPGYYNFRVRSRFYNIRTSAHSSNYRCIFDDGQPLSTFKLIPYFESTGRGVRVIDIYEGVFNPNDNSIKVDDGKFLPSFANVIQDPKPYTRVSGANAPARVKTYISRRDQHFEYPGNVNDGFWMQGATSYVSGLRNVAYHQDCAQSSNYQAASFLAPCAVDGDKTTFTQTSSTETGNPRWWVNFPVATVERVDLYNRQDMCKDRLRNVQVDLGWPTGPLTLLNVPSPVLNPQNTLLGPDLLQFTPTTPVHCTIAQVTRLPDTGAQQGVVVGDPQGKALTLSEVVAWGRTVTHYTAPIQNVARGQACGQSSTLNDFTAALAVDGNANTFSHTLNTQAGNAQWWVTFAAAAVKEVVLTNRPQGRWRLRNIVVELLLDGKVVATSPILNPLNVLNGPAKLTYAPVLGWTLCDTVRVTRNRDTVTDPTPDNADGPVVLSLGEVEVNGRPLQAFNSAVRNLSTGLTTAQQSSTNSSFTAGLALDGNRNTFSHTLSSQPGNAWWSVQMPVAEVLRIDLYNRDIGRERLRNITVTLLLDGEVVLFSGDVPLNKDNILGGPETISFTPRYPTVCDTVRVERIRDAAPGPGENADGPVVLTLAEVQVWGRTP